MIVLQCTESRVTKSMTKVLSAAEFREVFETRPLYIEDNIDAMYICYRLGHLQGFKDGKAHQIREDMAGLDETLKALGEKL